MSFREMLQEKLLLYDGSKGFLLIKSGLAKSDLPDIFNLHHPDAVEDIHRAYVNAGADVIQTNTMQSSRFHLGSRGLYEKLADINSAGVKLAKQAAGGKALVAASLAPLGKLMAPFGDMGFDEARDVFAEQICVLLEAGVDILHFETFTDLSELRAAVIAARGLSTDAPIIATLSLESGGRTIMGDDPLCAGAALVALGADCVGANCGLAPRALLSVFAPFAGVGAPLCSKPNAGAPSVENGELCYHATEEEFFETAFGFGRLGARLIGGCCGSGPSHIRRLREAVDVMNAGGNGGGGNGADYAGGGGNGGGNGADYAGGGVNKGQIRLCSFGKSFITSRAWLEECVNEALRAMSAQPPAWFGAPMFIESGNGKLLTVNVSCLCNRDGPFDDKIVDILSEADESDAQATVFCLFADRFDDRIPKAGCAAGRAAVTSEAASAILESIAVNARTYHKKPLAFFTDCEGPLRRALSCYCGAPAVIASDAIERRIRAAIAAYKVEIIGI